MKHPKVKAYWLFPISFCNKTNVELEKAIIILNISNNTRCFLVNNAKNFANFFPKITSARIFVRYVYFSSLFIDNFFSIKYLKI